MKHVLFYFYFFDVQFCTSGSDSACQVEEPENESQPAITHYPEINDEEISYNERGHDYGYLWWHNIFAGQSIWFAWDYGGQFVFIFPQLDAVVVVTADPDNRNRGFNKCIDIDNMNLHSAILWSNSRRS